MSIQTGWVSYIRERGGSCRVEGAIQEGGRGANAGERGEDTIKLGGLGKDSTNWVGTG